MGVQRKYVKRELGKNKMLNTHSHTANTKAFIRSLTQKFNVWSSGLVHKIGKVN